VHFIGSGITIRGPKVQNFKENILTTPKLHDVWLSA
jgi:hypothetical protein